MSNEKIFKKLFPKTKQITFVPVADGGAWKNYKAIVDNKLFKVSKCESLQQAKFVEQAAKIFLKHKLPFPKILKRYKKWLLQEWIAGEFLEEKKLTKKLVKELAIVLGKMHAISTTNIKGKRLTITSKTKFVLKKLDYLKQKKAVSEKQAKKIKKYLIEKAPKEYSLCLTHRDFTMGNIILKHSHLHKIIDYEDTCIDIKEYDIARTIYSLHLNKKQEKSFLKEYSKFASPKMFEKNKKYWLTMIKIHKTANRFKRRIKKIQKETKEQI